MAETRGVKGLHLHGVMAILLCWVTGFRPRGPLLRGGDGVTGPWGLFLVLGRCPRPWCPRSGQTPPRAGLRGLRSQRGVAGRRQGPGGRPARFGDAGPPRWAPGSGVWPGQRALVSGPSEPRQSCGRLLRAVPSSTEVARRPACPAGLFCTWAALSSGGPSGPFSAPAPSGNPETVRRPHSALQQPFPVSCPSPVFAAFRVIAGDPSFSSLIFLSAVSGVLLNSLTGFNSEVMILSSSKCYVVL